MTATHLRRAATLMRERASGAASCFSYSVPEWHSPAELMGEGKTRGDAEHIASWHPAVALAVADWLDAEFNHQFGPSEQAIDVACLYLGGDA